MRVRVVRVFVVAANGQRLSCVSPEEVLICTGLSVIIIVIKCK